MSYSSEWDTAYQNGQARQVLCPATFIQFFSQWVASLEGEAVLELGCGVGPNAEYLAKLGAKYVGVDASKSAITEAKALRPYAQFLCCDFTKNLPRLDLGWDLIFDRAAVCHNDSESVADAMKLVFAALKPGGIYVGCDWFSSRHSEARRADIVDERTRTAYPDGQFQAVGKVHFTDEAELAELFGPFERTVLQERITRRPKPGVFGGQNVRWISRAYDDEEYVSAVWDIVVRKPK